MCIAGCISTKNPQTPWLGYAPHSVESMKFQAFHVLCVKDATTVRTTTRLRISMANSWAVKCENYANPLKHAAIASLKFSATRTSRPLVRSYLRFAYPLAIPTALGALAITLDKTLIQLFWGVTQTGLPSRPR